MFCLELFSCFIVFFNRMRYNRIKVKGKRKEKGKRMKGNEIDHFSL